MKRKKNDPNKQNDDVILQLYILRPFTKHKAAHKPTEKPFENETNTNGIKIVLRIKIKKKTTKIIY